LTIVGLVEVFDGWVCWERRWPAHLDLKLMTQILQSVSFSSDKHINVNTFIMTWSKVINRYLDINTAHP